MKSTNSNTNAESGTTEINKMGVMPVGRLLFTMSLPAVFSMLIQALYNVIDSIFVGFLGQSALTAVTLIFPIQMLIISVGVGTGIGMNSLISRRLGARNFEEANNAADHGFILAMVNWVIFALFGIFFSGPFVRAFSDTPTTTADGIVYCQVVAIGSVFLFVVLNVEKILQAMGNMVYPMIFNLAGAITNIILDPILIFGLFGAPKLGVFGAAIATVIGEGVAMVIGLILLFSYKHEIKVNFSHFKIRWKTIRDIYAVGLPSIIMQAIGSIMLIGVNAILIAFSEAAVAVFGVYFRLQSFVFMPVFGLTQGAMPIFGYNFGARNRKRLMSAFKWTLLTAVIIMAVGTVLFQIFPLAFLNMFSASKEMIEIGVPALRIISLSFIFAAVGIITSALFQAINHGNMSLLISLLRQLFLILPFAYIFAHFISLYAVWFSFPLAEFIALLVTGVLLKYVYDRQLRNLEKLEND